MLPIVFENTADRLAQRALIVGALDDAAALCGSGFAETGGGQLLDLEQRFVDG